MPGVRAFSHLRFRTFAAGLSGRPVVCGDSPRRLNQPEHPEALGAFGAQTGVVQQIQYRRGALQDELTVPGGDPGGFVGGHLFTEPALRRRGG